MSIVRAGAASGATDGARLRVAPWRGGHGAVQVIPVSDKRLPVTPDDIARCLSRLAERNVTVAYTSALTRPEQQPFLTAGFRVVERLHLLLNPLDTLPNSDQARCPVSIRRVRRRDRAAVLTVDRAAFDDFWHLDDAGLTEALQATTSVHFRLAIAAEDVVGYAVCGRAGTRGYVQRLAVQPALHGRGIGRALLVDGLQWLRRRGAHDAIVNTQLDNTAALHLYQRHGFVLQPEGLAVLRTDLAPPGKQPASPDGQAS